MPWLPVETDNRVIKPLEISLIELWFMSKYNLTEKRTRKKSFKKFSLSTLMHPSRVKKHPYFPFPWQKEINLGGTMILLCPSG